MKKTAPTNLTLPERVVEDTDNRFVQPIAGEKFFGRPSKSMVVRALLEIALECSDDYDVSNVSDYESLKVELSRILASRAKG